MSCSAAVPSFAQTAKAGVAGQARGPSREDGASRQAQGASPEEQFLLDAANRERAARQLARPGETFTLEYVDDKACMQCLEVRRRMLANDKTGDAEVCEIDFDPHEPLP